MEWGGAPPCVRILMGKVGWTDFNGFPGLTAFEIGPMAHGLGAGNEEFIAWLLRPKAFLVFQL